MNTEMISLSTQLIRQSELQQLPTPDNQKDGIPSSRNASSNFQQLLGDCVMALENLELSSSSSRIKRETTTVHLTDLFSIPFTMVNPLNNFRPIDLTNTSTLHNIIDEEQEGSRVKRIILRTLYRFHLSMERAKASKLLKTFA